MEMIACKDLKYSYPVFNKEPGFLKGLKDFFHREISYVKAIDGVNCQIGQGELIGLLGENGAGKTTLMKLLSGILTPQGGEVSVLGYAPQRREHAFLQDIGVMFGQKTQLIWDLPAIDTFHSLKVIYGIEEAAFKKDLDFLLEKLNLKDKLFVPVRKLSLGQIVKFNLIATVIHRPKLLMLDEPTIGVDILSQSNIHDFLLSYNQIYGATILLSSHNTKDIRAVAKRILFLDKGQVLYDGPLSQFRFSDNPQHSYVLRTKTDSLPAGFDASRMRCEKIDTASYRISVQTPGDLSCLDFSDITSIQEEESDLDETLKAFYRAQNQARGQDS